jgi:hypothetical protein
MNTKIMLPVPASGDIATGLKDTRLLMRLRWRSVRSVWTKLLVWVSAVVLAFTLIAMSNAGAAVKQFATNPHETALTQFALNYLIAFERGQLGLSGALALGSAVAASVFSPFTGASNLSLTPSDDLGAIRPHRLHRYFDAFLLQTVSTISVLQLLSLVGVTSLLTLNGGRTVGMVTTLTLWVALITLSTAIGWSLEYLRRTKGQHLRRLIAGAAAGVLGAALLLNKEHGMTLFGAGTAYSDFLQNKTQTPVWLPAVGLLVFAGVLFVYGITMCQMSLTHPDVSVATKKNVKIFSNPKTPRGAVTQMVLTQIFRTNEIRQPILLLSVLMLPGVWLSRGNEIAMTTTIIAIPLSVALSWGANIFGVIGPGMTWLSNQPKAFKLLLDQAVFAQLSIVTFISVTTWVPLILLGTIPANRGFDVLLGLTAATAVTTRSAVTKSIYTPTLARLGTRGSSTLPPLTAVNYTLRFAMFGGQIGVIVTSISDQKLQLILTATICAWQTLRYMRLRSVWADRNEQCRVTSIVSPV